MIQVTTEKKEIWKRIPRKHKTKLVSKLLWVLLIKNKEGERNALKQQNLPNSPYKACSNIR